MKNAGKTDILTRAVSTGVLTDSVLFSFVCFFKIFMCCAESTRKWGKNKNTKIIKTCRVKIWSKFVLKVGPNMLCNKNWTSFKHNFLVMCYIYLFFLIPFFLQGERDFQIQKKHRTNGPLFNTKRANIGPVFNSTAYIYICCRVNNLAGFWPK